jgi:DNA-binding Lrp family transcriptional regulator
MLDELGLKIIGELQEDARQSFREIGRKLKVSEGTVRNRVKGLVTGNTMKISAIPNPEKLGLNFMCIMFTICAAVRVPMILLVFLFFTRLRNLTSSSRTSSLMSLISSGQPPSW